MEDQQYLILDCPFPKEALRLGTLVRDYSNPTEDFYFPEHLAGTQDQWIRTDKNVEEMMTASPTKIGRSLRRRILSSYTSTDLSKTYQQQSVECQVYQLKNTSAWFEKLGTDEQTRAWLLERLKQRQDVYLLTGYRTFRDGVFKGTGRKTTVFVGPSSTDPEVRLRFRAVEEVIYAVSYRKIRLKRFDKIQKASLQRERNWLRPWASLHVKKGDKSKGLSSTGMVEGHVHSTTLTADDRDDVSDQGLASETAERGRSKPPSPPSTLQRSMPGLFEPLPGSTDIFPSQASEISPTFGTGSISARQDILPHRSMGVEEPDFLGAPVPPAVHGKNTVHELVYEVDGFQEVVQLEQLDTRIVSDTDSMTSLDDDAWSDIIISSASSMGDMSIAMEEWVRMLIDESSLKSWYKKAFDVIAKKDFEGTFARLLREFSKDIKSSAASYLEEIAAHFVRTRARRTATLVTRYLYATDLDHTPAIKSPTENSASLNSFFARLEADHEPLDSSHEVDSVRELGGDDGDDGDDSDDDQDLPTSLDLPHLSDVKSFLLDGSAFVRFREALETYVDLRDDVGHSVVETVQESTPSKAGIPMSGLLFYVPSRTNILVAVTSAIAAAYSWSHTDCSEEGCVVRKRWIQLRPLGIVAMLLVFVLSLFIPFKSVLHAVTSKRIQTRIFNGLGQLLTRFITDLRIVSRPQVPHGHERIEWVCDCGISLYGDFEVTDSESMDAIKEYLNPASSDSGSSNDNTNSLRNGPTVPQQVHVNPRGSLSRATRNSDANIRSNAPAQVDTRSRSLSPEKPKKYFELCVNRGKWEKRLGEIDITNMDNDGDLFRAIAEKYDSVRGIRAKNLYLLEPANIHFVRFSLEDRHLVNIDEKPDSWPSPDFVSNLQSWEYTHPPKISAANFLHHMRSKSSHPRSRWLPTLPKKLKCRMVEEESDLPTGWGVHIIEGLNKPLVSWLFWVTTLVVFGLSVLWSIWKQKGVGVGPLALGILALAGSFLISKFYEQLDT